MKKRGIPALITGLVIVIAGVVVLGYNNIGVLLIVAGIISLILGSVMLMFVSGQNKSLYFDKGLTHSTDTPSQKEPWNAPSDNPWDQIEQKRE